MRLAFFQSPTRLALGLAVALALGSQAFADDEIEKLVKQWRDFFLSEQAVYGGAEDFFSTSRAFTPAEAKALQIFLASPEGQAAYARASQNILDYFASLDRDRARLIQSQYPGIRLDPGADFEDSFERFVATQTLPQAQSISDAEADRIAMSVVRQRYGNFLDLREPDQKRDYEREFVRAKLVAENRKHQPGITREAWEAWIRAEKGRVDTGMQENMREMLRLTMELFPGEVMIGKSDAMGMMNLDAATSRPLSPEDLNGASLFRSEAPISTDGVDALRGGKEVVNPLVDTSWRIRLSDGRTFAVANQTQMGAAFQRLDYRHWSPPYSTASWFNTPPFEDERYRVQNLRSRERQLKLHALNRAKHTYDNLYLTQYFLQKREALDIPLVFHPDPRVARLNVQKFARRERTYFFTDSAALRDLMYLGSGLPPSDATAALKRAMRLFWLHGQPDAWKSRDESAVHRMPIGRVVDGASTAPGVSYLMSDPLSRIQNARGYGSITPAIASPQQLKLPLPSNTPEEALDKTIHFRTNQIAGILDIFFEVPILNHGGAIEPYTPTGAADFTLRSEWPISPTYRRLGVPTPQGHELSGAQVRNANGLLLTEGIDYQFIREVGRGTYAIEIAPHVHDSLFTYEVSFARSPPAPFRPLPPPLDDIDVRKIRALANDLRSGGFHAIAEGFEKLAASGKKVTVKDLEATFDLQSLYSYDPRPADRAPPIPRTGRFASYDKFVNEKGVACVQCDGANQLFRDVLGLLFEDNPQITVTNRVGYLTNEPEIRADDMHLRTEVRVEGYPYVQLDATPSVKDPIRRSVVRAVHGRPPAEFGNRDEVERFAREFEKRRTAFAEALGKAHVIPDKNSIWVSGVRLGTVLSDYMNGTIRLEDVNRFLEMHLPAERLKVRTHQEMLENVRAFAHYQGQALEKLFKEATQSPSVYGGAPYRNGAVHKAFTDYLNILRDAEKVLSEENLAAFRAARPKPSGPACAIWFGGIKAPEAVQPLPHGAATL